MQLFSYAVIIYTISSPKQSLKMQYNFWQITNWNKYEYNLVNIKELEFVF